MADSLDLPSDDDRLRTKGGAGSRVSLELTLRHLDFCRLQRGQTEELRLLSFVHITTTDNYDAFVSRHITATKSYGAFDLQCEFDQHDPVDGASKHECAILFSLVVTYRKLRSIATL